MTNQEAFDRVWEHFIVDGGPPSINAGGACRYRSLDGAKCAIGILIPDEEYSPNFENRSAGVLVNGGPKFEPLACLKGINAYFAEMLQHCHDSAAQDNPEAFHSMMNVKLTALAANRGLTIPTMEKE